MSFRCRQKYLPSPCSSVLVTEESTLETGLIIHKSVDSCDKVLPEPELFDLEDNINAGVNLKEVNSKIYKGSSISIPDVVGKDLKVEEVKTNETEEVNNEN